MNQNLKYGLFFLGGMAVGALGAVVVTRGKLDIKPLASSLISEGMNLREKALAAVDSVKEDLADVVAEAQVKNQEKKEKREAAEAAQCAAEEAPACCGEPEAKPAS